MKPAIIIKIVNGRDDNSYIIGIGIAGAAFTMAYQVAGKAARDALFLSNFQGRYLAAMVMAAALIAILLGVVNSRLLTRYSPGRLIPALMVASGSLQALEWLIYQHFPRWTSVAVYIHVVSLGAIITSGFWSVINEQLDPRTAKQNFGRITGAGTIGGMAGGFISERLGAMASPSSVLLAMAVAQFATAILLAQLPAVSSPREKSLVRARDVLRSSSYMRNLSVLVLIGTFSAALLDYVLKVEARHTFGPGEPLLRFFALFHTGTAVLSFLIQAFATPHVLNRFGLGPTVSTLPAAVASGGLLAVFTGGFSVLVIARALEAVIRGSLFRAGYELFYTPMLASEKRAVKSINDVTVDRLGDGLGGGYAQVMLFYGGALANPLMLGTAAAASAISFILAGRLYHAYVESLERSLAQHAIDLDLSDADDAIAQSVAPATAGLPVTQGLPAKNTEAPIPPPPWLRESLAGQWMDLASGDAERIKKALRNGPPLERPLLPYAIPLLARRSIAPAVRSSLEMVADRNAGQLSDYLLDPTTPLAVRRALPAILASTGNDRAASALVLALKDKQFEVRFETSRALDTLKQTSKVSVEADEILSAIRRELTQRIDPPNLDFVFSLIGVVLPREPVRAAFEGLTTKDQQLRGLALEYLESALPEDIGEALLRLVDTEHPEHEPSAIDDLREELTKMIQQVRGKTP
jgi:ATP/ADP translocase